MSPVHQVWPKPSYKTMKGGRRQGRQRKRWEDNIREWTGLELVRSQSAVENRENWLRNHLWCPNDPHGLGIDDDDEYRRD